MSNKQQLQTNNTKYASLIETLRSKAAGGGEDVTVETTAYTEKIAQLESAVTALETELAGKASGGGGGNVETCTVTITHAKLIDSVIYYTGADMQYTELDTGRTTQSIIEVAKNTILYLNTGYIFGLEIYADGALIINPNDSGDFFLKISDDCLINLQQGGN